MRSRRLDWFVDEKVHDLPKHGWGTILVIFGTYLAMLLLVIFVLYQFDVFDVIRVATAGVVNDTFMGTLVLAVVVILVLLLRVKKVTLRDLGVTPRAVAGGLSGLGVLYALLTLVLVIVVLAGGGEVMPGSLWVQYPASYIAGAFIAQVVMVGPVEEIVFRGYLLPQITLKAKGIPNISRQAALFLGILGSSALFALMHLPIRLWTGTNPWMLLQDQFRLLGMGVYFSFIYLVTGNLVMAMSIHALGNFPMLFLEPTIQPFYILFLIVIVMLLSWSKVSRALRRGTHGDVLARDGED